MLIKESLRWTHTAWFAATLMLSGSARGVEVDKLERYLTRGPESFAYRAIMTPGRLDNELLPLIVFMHGSGQNGRDNASQLGGYGNGSLELVDAALDASVPLVFAAPQVDADYWPPTQIAAIVHDALRRFPIDPHRIILTGVSNGGTGVWTTLKAYPTCFAAGVPMSGMTELAGLASIRDVPQWIFHGEKDNDTNIETGYGGAMLGSRAVVRALRAMGGTPQYSEYAGEMHVIWHRAYGEDKLLPWMLNRRLQTTPCDFSAAR